MFFSHVYSPRQGQTTHWGQKFYDNRKAFSLCPYAASFKMISSKSDFIHIFNNFIHVYSPGKRAKKTLGTNFWCQQKALITSTICCKFQTNLFEAWFFTIFFFFVCFFHIYIAPGRGRQPIGDKNFMTTERPFLFAHMLQVSKWSLRNLILYTFLIILYMYIAPGKGQKKPVNAHLTPGPGINFNAFIHVYSPRAGADNPLGTNVDVNRKPLSLRPFVARFKQISLNSDFIHIF